jgi:hypothetical protein
MPARKIITIFGATGGQGGGIIDTFLNDPVLKHEWTVRGVTRDKTKSSAIALAARGVEVVMASFPTLQSPCLSIPCHIMKCPLISDRLT